MFDLAEFAYQAVQVIGSLFILVAFIATLMGKTQPSSWSYLIANVTGSVILTATAAIRWEWGFILLEGVWAIVSIVTIVRKASGKSTPTAH